VRKPPGLAALALLAGLLLALSAWVESRGGGPDAAELRASRAMASALALLRTEASARGIVPDPALDPGRTGLIGLSYSPLTSTLGSLPAKRTGLQPAAAAVLARLLREAGLRPGGRVGVDTSGSFPGFAVATLVAVEALGAEPTCLVSLGASSYGANRPEFSLADMLQVLARRGLLRHGPVAVSPGGDLDQGRNLGGPELEGALARTGLPVLRERDLAADVAARRALLGRVDVLVVVGGSWATTGGEELGMGILRPTRTPRGIGLVQTCQREGIPVLRILDVKALCLATGLPYDPPPPDGSRMAPPLDQ
jgi:poly-gamma-glutamate system protein